MTEQPMMDRPTTEPGSVSSAPSPRTPSPRTLSPRARWAVPAVAAAAVAVAFLAPPLLAAASGTDLPELTPEQLVTAVAGADPAALSGTAVYTARLGLPEIPFGDVGGADPVALLGGSSTLRVWTDGAGRSRVSLLGATSEYSVVHDGPEAWTYSSADDAVLHYTLDAEDLDRYAELDADLDAGAAGDLPTPQQAGTAVLEDVEEYSTVSADGQTTVAGRAAYQLVVTPLSTTTLVGQIVVAVDGETFTPLRVQVWSSQDATAPAVELGFTDVSFAVPDDAVLTFSEPPGATVTEVVVPLPELTAAHEGATLGGAAEKAPDGVSVTGSGWDTVVRWSGLDVAGLLAADPAAVATLPGVDGAFGQGELLDPTAAEELYREFLSGDGSGPVGHGGLDLDAGALYQQLTTVVPEGRLLSSTLLSVLVTDDGEVLAGAVPAETLRAMAR